MKLQRDYSCNTINPMAVNITDSQYEYALKNYMFCGNHESVDNMCVTQSLLATCRNHNVYPRLYLNSVIASMPYFDKAAEEDLIQFLPHRRKEYHPEAIMITPIRHLAK